MNIIIKFKDGREDTFSDVDWIIIDDNKIVINKSYKMCGYYEITIKSEYVKNYIIERN